MKDTMSKVISVESLEKVTGGAKLRSVGDTRINWLVGHNIKCPHCGMTDEDSVVVSIASNGSDAQCNCTRCGYAYKYRLIDNEIWIVR